jgi:hypothetical protein
MIMQNDSTFDVINYRLIKIEYKNYHKKVQRKVPRSFRLITDNLITAMPTITEYLTKQMSCVVIIYNLNILFYNYQW